MPIKEFFIHKARQIIIPALIWSAFFFAIEWIALGKEPQFSLDINKWIPFWFLKALIICYVLGYISQRFRGGVMVTLLLCLPISYCNVTFLYPAFLMGVYVKKKWKWVECRKNILLCSSAFLYVLLFLFWNENNWHLSEQVNELIQNGNNKFSIGCFLGLKLLHKELIGLAGSLFLVLLSMRPTRLDTSKASSILSKCGQYTLVVYIIQSYVLEKLLPMYIDFTGYNTYLYDYIITPGIALLLLVVMSAIAIIMDKQKHMRMLLLGKY